MISKVLRDFPLQPKSATEISWLLVHYNFDKQINAIKKDRTLWLSHGTCSYISMYINAVAGSVTLYLQQDFIK
jgi:hypothetical protein